MEQLVIRATNDWGCSSVEERSPLVQTLLSPPGSNPGPGEECREQKQALLDMPLELSNSNISVRMIPSCGCYSALSAIARGKWLWQVLRLLTAPQYLVLLVLSLDLFEAARSLLFSQADRVSADVAE